MGTLGYIGEGKAFSNIVLEGGIVGGNVNSDIIKTTGILTLAATETNAGQVIIRGTDDSVDAIQLDANDNAAGGINIDTGTGGVDIDSTGPIVLTTTDTTSSAVHIQADTGSGGVNVDTGTGGLDIDTTGSITMDSTSATMSVTNTASDAYTINALNGYVKANTRQFHIIGGTAPAGLDGGTTFRVQGSVGGEQDHVFPLPSGGIGGEISISAGQGGNNISTGFAGDGGDITIQAGDGGAGVLRGQGGSVSIAGGIAGSGGGAAAGGGVNLTSRGDAAIRSLGGSQSLTGSTFVAISGGLVTIESSSTINIGSDSSTTAITVGGAPNTQSLTLGSTAGVSATTIRSGSAGTIIANGTRIDTSVGFFGTTPIAQRTTGNSNSATRSPGSAGGTFNTDDTYDGYTLHEIVGALRQYGILA